MKRSILIALMFLGAASATAHPDFMPREPDAACGCPFGGYDPLIVRPCYCRAWDCWGGRMRHCPPMIDF